MENNNTNDTKKRKFIVKEEEKSDLNLPDELLVKIFSFCGVHDFCSISSVDKRFNKLSTDSGLWKMYFQRTFGDTEWYQLRNDLSPNPAEIHWFVAFKAEYNSFRTTLLSAYTLNCQKDSRVLVYFFPPTDSSYIEDNKLVGIIRDVIHLTDKQIQSKIQIVRWWEHLDDLPAPEPISTPLRNIADEAIFLVDLFHVEKILGKPNPLFPQQEFKYNFKPFKTILLPEHVMLVMPTKCPPSPNGAFMLFLKERLCQIRKEDEMTMKEASAMLVSGWKDLAKDERKVYDQASNEELRKYKLELELYKVFSSMKNL